jgi:hypothetical protein
VSRARDGRVKAAPAAAGDGEPAFGESLGECGYVAGELQNIAGGEEGLDNAPARQPLGVRHGKRFVPEYRAQLVRCGRLSAFGPRVGTAQRVVCALWRADDLAAPEADGIT